MSHVLIIGAGPAGLMAAEVAAKAGHRVTVADAMPSVGRKFLMAGKSGLNLTMAEDIATFIAAYGRTSPQIHGALSDFGPDAVVAWAQGLGQEVFTGTSGRVFPKAMKASPLLRAWLRRLSDLGVVFKTRWRWCAEAHPTSAAVFDTPDGRITVQADAVILALGGASWRRLGSDGAWVEAFPDVTPFAPANNGLSVVWSTHMARHFGSPVKGVALHAGDQISRGEWMISRDGIEGGGVYAVSKPVRDGAALTVDLMPDWPLEKVAAALTRPRGKATVMNHLRKVLRLDPVRLALLSEWGRPLPDDLAPVIKGLRVGHDGARPMDEAISTAGGLRFEGLTDQLMIKDSPGVFASGEMLDWEAPTGGYLMTGCFATGQLAGQGAVDYLS